MLYPGVSSSFFSSIYEYRGQISILTSLEYVFHLKAKILSVGILTYYHEQDYFVILSFGPRLSAHLKLTLNFGDLEPVCYSFSTESAGSWPIFIRFI